MCNLYIGGTYSNFMSKKSSSQPHGPPCKQTRMEAIERLRFLASFGPPVPGTGKRKGGEKTQTFNRFHSHPGTNWTALCICNVHHRKNSVASGHSCGLGVEELRLWPHLEAKLRMTQKHLVLMFNVGPNIFIDLSYICQKSVRKLSVPKICLKTVWIVSDICQKSDSAICHNYVIKDLDMSQKCIRRKKIVGKLSLLNFENCQKSVTNITHAVKHLLKNARKLWNDTFLIHF